MFMNSRMQLGKERTVVEMSGTVSEGAYDIAQIQVARTAGVGFFQVRTHDSVLLHSQAVTSVVRLFSQTSNLYQRRVSASLVGKLEGFPSYPGKDKKTARAKHGPGECVSNNGANR